MAIRYNGINIESVKYNNTNLDKVVYNSTVVFELWSKAFTEVKKATGGSHYGVDLTVDTSYLSNIKVTKLDLYSSSRERTGDSHIKISFKTENGDNFSQVQTGYNGTLKDGTTYTWSNSTHGQTITFAKPVKLTYLWATAGSGVGQWRESDDVQITITGVRKG